MLERKIVPGIRKSLLVRMGGVVAVVLLALSIQLLVAPWLAGDGLLLFVVAVLASAFIGGVLAGVFATLLSAALADYFLISPDSFLVQEVGQNLYLGIFVLLGLAISGVRAAFGSVKQTEERLLASQRTLAASSQGLVVANATLPGQPITYVNEAFERITGYRLEEVRGRNCRFLQGTDREQPAIDEMRVAIEEVRECQTVLRNYCKDGTLFYNELLISPVQDQKGGVKYFVGTINDITRRIQAEKNCQESEEKFQSLVRHASDIIMVLDRDGTVRYESPAIERILGYESEERVGESAFDLIHPEDAERVRHAFVEQLGKPGTHPPIEYRMKDKGGTWRQLEAISTNLLDDPTINGVVVNSRDITDRKRAEAEIRQQVELLDLSYEPIFAWELEAGIVYWNRGSEELYGFSRDQALGQDSSRLLKTSYPISEEKLKDTLEYERRWAGELRQIDSEGRQLVVESRQALLRTEDGRRLVLETNRDITERRRMEAALRQSERLYRTVVERAASIIFLVDTETLRILEFNEGFCRSLGYEAVEVYSLTLYDLVAHNRESVDQNVRRIVEEGEYFVGERQYRRKDETLLDVEVNVSTIQLHGRQTMCIVTHDVTERKRSEEIKTRQVHGAALRTDISEAFDKSDTLQGALGLAADAIRRRFGVGEVCVWTTNSKTGLLEIRSATDGPQEVRWAAGYPSLQETINIVLESRHPYVSNDVRSDPALGNVDWSSQEHVVATANYPLEIGDRLVGGIALFSETPLSDDVHQPMTAVKHTIAQGIQRKWTEESLRESLSVLLALREAGYILGSTLEQDEIVSRLLQIMQRVSNLTATIISVPNEDGRLRIWRSVGVEDLPPRIRYAPEAERARQAVLRDEEQHLFRLEPTNSESGYFAVLCLPIRARNRIFGVLEAYGSEALIEDDMVEILGSLAGQAASALENARLYRDLGEREQSLQGLIGKLLGAQEEERRRVAYEVHDGLAQVAVAAHQHLQAFARRHQPTGEGARQDLEQVMRLVRGTVSDARRIIAHLRPTTLDDFGLTATVSLEVESLREEGYVVEYEENLGDERLPANVEIALFRAVQESLTNVRKHARTKKVTMKLWRKTDEISIEIRDYGGGFDPAAAQANRGPGERVGLAGMYERITMLEGSLEIDSEPNNGTRVTASVPV